MQIFISKHEICNLNEQTERTRLVDPGKNASGRTGTANTGREHILCLREFRLFKFYFQVTMVCLLAAHLRIGRIRQCSGADDGRWATNGRSVNQSNQIPQPTLESINFLYLFLVDTLNLKVKSALFSKSAKRK